MIPVSFLVAAPGFLGLALVEGNRWLTIRAWGMLLSSLLFPIVTIASSFGVLIAQSEALSYQNSIFRNFFRCQTEHNEANLLIFR